MYDIIPPNYTHCIKKVRCLQVWHCGSRFLFRFGLSCQATRSLGPSGPWAFVQSLLPKMQLLSCHAAWCSTKVAKVRDPWWQQKCAWHSLRLALVVKRCQNLEATKRSKRPQHSWHSSSDLQKSEKSVKKNKCFVRKDCGSNILLVDLFEQSHVLSFLLFTLGFVSLRAESRCTLSFSSAGFLGGGSFTWSRLRKSSAARPHKPLGVCWSWFQGTKCNVTIVRRRLDGQCLRCGVSSQKPFKLKDFSPRRTPSVSVQTRLVNPHQPTATQPLGTIPGKRWSELSETASCNCLQAQLARHSNESIGSLRALMCCTAKAKRRFAWFGCFCKRFWLIPFQSKGLWLRRV